MSAFGSKYDVAYEGTKEDALSDLSPLGGHCVCERERESSGVFSPLHCEQLNIYLEYVSFH